MPQNPNLGGLAARPLPTQPKPGLLDQILALVGGHDELPDNIKQARDLLSKEDPAAATMPLQSMGWFGKAIKPGAQALTNPFTGTVSVNSDVVKGEQPQDMADMLLHELTHKRQVDAKGVTGRILEALNAPLARLQYGQQLYGQIPDEQEAFQVEGDRRTRMGRPPAMGTPHFLDDSVETRGDIVLGHKYVPKKK